MARWESQTTTSRESSRYLPAKSSLAMHPAAFMASDDSRFGRGRSSYSCRKIRTDISDEEKQEILMAFEIFDSRKSGKLNCRELKVAMRALDFKVTQEDARKIIQDFTKGQPEIDQDEFMEIMTQMYKDRDPVENLEKAFKFFDEDNTGKISLHNLKKVAKDLGEHITDDELAAMIDEFDKDGDGEINQSEFLGIMKRADTYL